MAVDSKDARGRDETLPTYTDSVRSPGWRSLASVTVAASDCSPIKSSFSYEFPSPLHETPYDKC